MLSSDKALNVAEVLAEALPYGSKIYRQNHCRKIWR